MQNLTKKIGIFFNMRDKKEHEELIKKYYSKGYTLINFPNPTFGENETFESFKNKCNNIVSQAEKNIG